LGAVLDSKAAGEIARRARGTPRVAGRLLRRVRDFASVDGERSITLAAAQTGLARLDIDDRGLDTMDRRYLRCIAETYGGGPVGVETIAAVLSEQRDMVEDVIEPFLIQAGLVQRTPRGRMITQQTWAYLGIEAPKDAAPRQLDLLGQAQEGADDGE